MGRTKTSRYRNWRKQMRKRGQRPPRKRYTWDYMSPGRLVAYADPEPAKQQKNWNRYKVQPASKSNRSRPITREEPRTWDTPNAARERARLQKMEKAMDGVGWTAAIITGLLILLVIIVQVGKRFYGW